MIDLLLSVVIRLEGPRICPGHPGDAGDWQIERTLLQQDRAGDHGFDEDRRAVVAAGSGGGYTGALTWAAPIIS